MSTTVNWQIVHRKVSIAGIVQDSETKEAIVGARVEITNSKKWTLTRSDGWFFFRDLPSGKYPLTVTVPGGTRYGTGTSEATSTNSKPGSDNLNLKIFLPQS